VTPPAISAHDLLKTRDCAAPLCTKEAERGSDLCAEHDAEEVQKFRRRAAAVASSPPSTDRDLELEREKRCEDALEAIRSFVKVHGRTPLSAECSPANGLPSCPMLKRLFGSFGNAVVEAGFARPTRGRRVARELDVVLEPAAPPVIKLVVGQTSASTFTDLSRELDELLERVRAQEAELEETRAALRAALAELEVAAETAWTYARTPTEKEAAA